MSEFVIKSDSTTEEDWAATAVVAPRRRRLPRWVGVVVAAVAVTVGVVLVFRPDSPDPQSVAQVTPPVSSAAPTAEPVGGPSTPACPASVDGALQRGAGPGSQATAVGVVFAFQHAYWVDRSGVGVRAVAAPDAALPPAGEIQRGIDSVPLGSTHCLAVSVLPDGRLGVELAYQSPGGVPVIERQTVTVAERDGKFWVQGVTA